MYEGLYELAISNFNLAFTLIDQPKARDFFLAAKCYSQLNKVPEMLTHLELAVRGGLDKSFIASDSLWFSDYLFSKDYKSILRIHPETINASVDKEAEAAFTSLDKKFKLSNIIQYYKSYDKRDSLPNAYNTSLQSFMPYSDSMTAQLVYYYYHHPFPSDQKKRRKFILMSKLFLSTDLACIDGLKSIFINNIDIGTATPNDFSKVFDRLLLKTTEPDQMTDRLYGMVENSIPEADFEMIVQNRKDIGLSTYYILAPNYTKNYKPRPIAFIIRHPKTGQGLH